jgi:uncharacterized membrane protein YdjX (TVP38/TMEM64 family)
MPLTDLLPPMRRALHGAQLWPAVRGSLAVLAFFALALWLSGHYALAIRAALGEYAALGLLVFFVSSALAVLLPVLSNLPLLPLAVLAWGPLWSALLLLAGWVLGAMLSFWLARHAAVFITQRFPSVQRHAQIDRLIDPRHRLWSLVLLRATFPVDVLSYALGLFSPQTTLAEVALSTTLGAAPFAVLFAWFPTLSSSAQLGVFVASAAAFALYVWWVLRRGNPNEPGFKHPQ